MPRIIKPAKGTFTSSTVTIDSSGRVIAAASGAGAAVMKPALIDSTDGSTGTFTSNGNKLIVFGVGAGGGGGGATSNSGGRGGNGMSGLFVADITPPFSEPYAVGNAGGGGSPNPGQPGQAGTATSLANIFSVNGGNRGDGGQGTQTGDSGNSGNVGSGTVITGGSTAIPGKYPFFTSNANSGGEAVNVGSGGSGGSSFGGGSQGSSGAILIYDNA
tara:strand:- start:2567 stop:3214 length:648 start_codon:yes stop_codon:yes gene_type:complete